MRGCIHSGLSRGHGCGHATPLKLPSRSLGPAQTRRAPQGDAAAALRHARAVLDLETAARAAAAAAGDAPWEADPRGGAGRKLLKGSLVRIRNYQPSLVALALAGDRRGALGVAAELAGLAETREYLDMGGRCNA